MVQKLPEDYFSLIPKNQSLSGFIILFIFFALPFLNPTMIQRILMAKDKKQITTSLRVSSLITVLFYIVCGQIALSIFALNPNLEPNSVISYAVNNYVPPVLKGAAIIGMLAVVMSTADSYLNVISISIVHDIITPLIKKEMNNNIILFITRIVAVLIGIGAIIIAVNFQDIINIVVKAQMFWAPIITVPLYMAIFGVKANLKTFLFSALGGLITITLWNIFELEKTTGVENIIPGLIGNLIVFIISFKIFNLLSRNKSVSHQTI